jgi:hypothetical protein
LIALVVLVAPLAGCGSKSSSTPATPATHTHFAKTKFVIHAGLAFGVFHRYIYKPFKKGEFSHPLRHKVALLKAVAAALFVRHEVLLARQDARSSRLLSHVVLPLLAVGGAVVAIRSALAGHHAPPASSVNTAESSISSAEADSASAGQPICETTSEAPRL